MYIIYVYKRTYKDTLLALTISIAFLNMFHHNDTFLIPV